MDDFEMKIPKGNGCGGVGGARGNGRGGSNQPNYTNNPWKRSFKAKVTSIYGQTKRPKTMTKTKTKTLREQAQSHQQPLEEALQGQGDLKYMVRQRQRQPLKGVLQRQGDLKYMVSYVRSTLPLPLVNHITITRSKSSGRTSRTRRLEKSFSTGLFQFS